MMAQSAAYYIASSQQNYLVQVCVRVCHACGDEAFWQLHLTLHSSTHRTLVNSTCCKVAHDDDRELMEPANTSCTSAPLTSGAS
jgi:hypothetical protein